MAPQAQTTGLVNVFVKALTAPERAQDVDPAMLDQVLGEMTDRAQRAWPNLGLAANDFAKHLARSLDPKETDILEALLARHAEDLYLACACAAGIDQARTACLVRFRDTLALAIRRVDTSPSFGDEVLQSLLHRLFFEDSDHSCRIASYQGRGPLAGWLAITAQRAALNSIEHEMAQERAHQRAGTQALLIPPEDPELQFLKARYAPEFERAFEEAVGRLSTRERAVLRLRVVSQLTLARIGVMYKVDESTVSRWLAAARSHLEVETESILRARLNLSKGEMQSLVRLVASEVDVSVARLLSADQHDRDP